MTATSEHIEPTTDNDVPSRRGKARRAGGQRVHASLLVAAMKMLLPAIALTLIALVIVWPQILPDEEALGAASVSVADVDTSRMANPRFVGVDEAGRPYEIVARRAHQESAQADAVFLDQPQGDVTLQSGTWISLSAANGVWHRTAEVVDLGGGVNLFHDEGHQLSTDTARINIPEGSAESSVRTVGQSPSGVVEGEGFRLHERGARIMFTGRAKAVLNGAIGQDSEGQGSGG